MLRRIAASIVPPYEKSSFLFNILLSDIDVLIVSWCARVLLSFLYQQGYISRYFSAYSAHSLLVDLVTGYDALTHVCARALRSPQEIDIWVKAKCGYMNMFHRKLDMLSRAKDSLLRLPE